MSTEPKTLEQLMEDPDGARKPPRFTIWRLALAHIEIRHLRGKVRLLHSLLEQERLDRERAELLFDTLLEQIREHDVDVRHRRVLLPDRRGR